MQTISIEIPDSIWESYGQDIIGKRMETFAARKELVGFSPIEVSLL